MGTSLKIESTPIEGLVIAKSQPRSDHRGALMRCFCDDELSQVIGDRKVVQVNHSRTVQTGAIRGMHFQHSPYAEMKMVRCLKGRVWDVAVDLRCGSPTFLKWHATELTADNHQMFVIPEGFAHGFQVMEANSELLYLHTAHYHPSSEGGLRFDDPRLSIAWPLQPTDLSDRDRQHSFLTDSFLGLS
jgi:dTDP-4-dehydrorhamnose 3,5-epimerase